MTPAVIGSVIGGMVIMALLVKVMMPKVMFARYKSRLPFDETVTQLEAAAKAVGWRVPDVRDLQGEYHQYGLTDMTRVKILYFCNPEGGYAIISHDKHKPMSVLMPMGVSVYETSDGEVWIAAMNLGTMSMMFGGVVQGVLKNGGANFRKAIRDII